MDLTTFSLHIWILLHVIVCQVCNCFEGSTGFYADNGLGQTILIDRLPGRQRREMQQEILTLLGLHHRPRPTTHTKAKSAPKFMIDLYESLWKDSEDMHTSILNRKGLHVNISDNAAHHIDHADMIMSFVNQVAHHKYIKRDLDRRFYFDFGEVPVTEVVTEAELRIYKTGVRGPSRKKHYTVQVFNVKQGQDLEDRLLELQSSQRVRGSHEGWLEFEVEEAARQWHALPNTNLGLFMRVVDEKGVEVRPSSIGIVDLTGAEEQQAFMVGCFKSGAKLHQRSKRAAGGSRRKNSGVTYAEEPRWSYMRKDRYNTRTCQKKNLYVSFRELGWQDWIIAPDGYAAFYCYGECSFPLNAHMNATNHAIVQTLVHLMNPYTVPKPCCTPTELSGISVLFFDEKSNVILRKYANMVVQACGCH